MNDTAFCERVFLRCSFTCRTFVAKNCSCVRYLRVIALLFLILSRNCRGHSCESAYLRVIAFLRSLERTLHKDNGKHMNVRTKAINKESEEGNVL